MGIQSTAMDGMVGVVGWDIGMGGRGGGRREERGEGDIVKEVKLRAKC